MLSLLQVRKKKNNNLPMHFVLAAAGQLILSGAVALVAKVEKHNFTVFAPIISSHAHFSARRVLR